MALPSILSRTLKKRSSSEGLCWTSTSSSRDLDLKQLRQLGRRRHHLVRTRNLTAAGPCRSSSSAGSSPISGKIPRLVPCPGRTWSRRRCIMSYMKKGLDAWVIDSPLDAVALPLRLLVTDYYRSHERMIL